MKMTRFISSSVGDRPHQSDVEFIDAESDKKSGSVDAVIESLLKDARAGEISDYAKYVNICWKLISDIYIYFLDRK